MKRTFTLFLFSILITASVFTNPTFSQESEYRRGELIIQLKNYVSVESIENAFEAVDLKIKDEISDYMNVFLFSFDPSKENETVLLEAVKSHQLVKTAQFNHIMTLRRGVEENTNSNPFQNKSTIPNDTRFNEQWALNNTGQSGGVADADIDAVEAWDFTTGGVTALGDTIVVAVVDGGFLLTHPDLNFWVNRGEIPGNGIDDDGNGYIDDVNGWNAYNSNGTITSDGHGTHVSGIIGARGNNALGVAGVNWNVKVMAIQGSSSSEATVLKAYAYAHKNRMLYNQTNGQKGAFVVATNASFGVDYGKPVNFPLWCAFYDSMGVQGIVSFGATANLGINVDIQGDIPTACPSDFLVSVTNTNSSDAKNSGAAYGLTTIDLGAPGTSVLNTYLSNGYSSLTGTSMATPTAAGAFALMLSGANAGLMTAYRNNPASGALTFRQFLLESTDPIPALNGITVTGGRINAFNALLAVANPPDTIAPTQVTNLSVLSPSSNSLQLTWTAPFDTSTNGVVAYDLRRSLSPINDLNDFNNAIQIPFNGTPAPAGTLESFSVVDLSFSTTYYFALRSFDRWGNASSLSNAANGTTWGAPNLTVQPDSLYLMTEPGQIFVDSILLSNNATHNSTLNYSVEMLNNTFPENVVNISLVPVNRVNEDKSDSEKDNPTANYGSAIEGFGGPDAFGYKWIDSDDPNGPVYVWNDIAATGTAVTAWTPTGTFGGTDEGYAGPFNLGFNFKFYGQSKSQIYISSNGFLMFSTLNTNTFTNAAIPSAAVPNEIIAPFWDDLDAKSPGTVHYKQEGNSFIIQWTNYQRYSGTASYTFQVVLYSSGKILVYYNNITGTNNSATIGIENGAGTIGLQTAYNATYVKNNLALKFAAEPDWLAINNHSGLLYSGNQTAINLSFNSEDLPVGLYSMDVVVSTNDPSHQTVTIPVKMLVSNPVPVELTTFTADQKFDEVVLGWSTASESNNRGFQIERKNRDQSDWQIISFVDGKGTSIVTNNYNFRDKNLKPGEYSYRLRQIDFDGKISISQVVDVDITKPTQYELSQNYPNPFNPSTVIKYQLPEKSNVVLSLFNAIGEEVVTIVNQLQEAGVYNIDFNAGKSLKSGVYFYRINAVSVEGSGKIYNSTKKMLMLK
jgi:subtilisin family serine protease